MKKKIKTNPFILLKLIIDLNKPECRDNLKYSVIFEGSARDKIEEETDV